MRIQLSIWNEEQAAKLKALIAETEAIHLDFEDWRDDAYDSPDIFGFIDTDDSAQIDRLKKLCRRAYMEVETRWGDGELIRRPYPVRMTVSASANGPVLDDRLIYCGFDKPHGE